MSEQLKDRFGRIHRSLRISVTDRCNIRCQYCMSDGPIQFLPRNRLLSFEQISEFVRFAAPMGISRLRLTGGEPLVRTDIPKLVEMLKRIDGVDEVALTTNGMLLAKHIRDLVSAGLDRLNISLDTLRESTFQTLSRREGLESVLQGIEAAIDAGIVPRLNALVLRDINLDEVVDLVDFALRRNLVLRFIEFMPLDQDRNWQADRMVSGSELRQILADRFGPLSQVSRSRDSQPSHDYQFEDRPGHVGFIDPVSNPFCGSCDRLRLTADGKIRNCLFGVEEWDVKSVLESSVSTFEKQEAVRALLQSATWAKHASHGIAQDGFAPPQRAMFQIGG